MKASHAAAILMLAGCAAGCSTYSTRTQRAVVGTAIAVVIVGSAVHGSSRNKKNLAENLTEGTSGPGK